MNTEIKEAALSDMLEAREMRNWRQKEMLEKGGHPLVSFSMNIAGPIKNTPLIHRGFVNGRRELLARIRAYGGHVLLQEEIDAVTGCEGLYSVDLKAETLKKLTTQIEERTPMGRLFDLDVIGCNGEKLERQTARTCLICGRPAKECARSRTHSVQQLQAATKALLIDELNAIDTKRIGETAVRSLLYEVCITPKPGLVDRLDSGSHPDMDIYTFMSSAASLQDYFKTCAKIGMETAQDDPANTLQALRQPGIEAEVHMYEATDGINTHKGAIFSMGILCAACGRLQPQVRTDPARILEEAAAMTKGITARELASLDSKDAHTAGQKIYAQYGIGGIRAEAEAGFPAVLHHGLPTLEQFLAEGRTNDEAGCACLLSILANTADTNMIRRGGLEKQQSASREAAQLLASFDVNAVHQMNARFIQEHLSPGGSADLLALSWFLHFMKEA